MATRDESGSTGVKMGDSRTRDGGSIAASEPIFVSAMPARPDRRGGERRRGIAALVGAVARALAAGSEPLLLRERFEDELRTLVGARSVAVRDDPQPAPPHVMCFDIPASMSQTRARIEVIFEPSRMLDGWTCQILEAATHVAALVLDVERAQGRAPLSARTRADGAAPLIGSSHAIRAVRGRIERVAATDFTILIEGASGPQPHPSFTEVYG